MRKPRAAISSAVFFLVAPGTVVGVLPWLITGWEVREPLPYWVVARAVGLLLTGAGLVPLVHAFVEFVRAGGTPVPIAPTERLVVTGFNRYVRNPMYVALVVILLGETLLLGRPVLLLYAAAIWGAFAVWVRVYEEPTLSRQFGADYAAYRRAVPAYLPRLRPWQPSADDAGAVRNP